MPAGILGPAIRLWLADQPMLKGGRANGQPKGRPNGCFLGSYVADFSYIEADMRKQVTHLLIAVAVLMGIIVLGESLTPEIIGRDLPAAAAAIPHDQSADETLDQTIDQPQPMDNLVQPALNAQAVAQGD